ncbi:MAG TPA: polysaccharide deacetylase family protein [Longimicrobiales bacterium]|nr:polysaccharide deacetylase family protein [Longimicrobiales bacterium]
MQQSVRRFAWAAAVVGLAACADDTAGPIQQPNVQTETREIKTPNLPVLFSSSPFLQTCGTTIEMPILTGKYTPGSVTISNDSTNIYISMTVKDTAAGWFISDTRLAVEKSQAAIPQTTTELSPWSYKIGKEHNPVTQSFTYTVSLASVAATKGTQLYISLMIGVVHPTNPANWDSNWEWIQGWAKGATLYKKGYIQAYTVQACGSPTTPPTQPPPPPPPPPPSSTTGTGVITITFDDGWKEHYSRVFPIFKSIGLVGNLAVNPTPIDEQWGDYMNFTQVREMNNAGWIVVSHSMSHPDLTRLTATQLDNELKLSKDWITAKGLKTANVFVVPFHSWGARERTAIQKYYSAARGYTADQFSPPKYSAYPITQRYDVTAFEPEYVPFTTADGRADVMEVIDYVVKNGLYLDLLFHHVTAAQEASFKTLMTDIATKYKANIRTYAQVF